MKRTPRVLIVDDDPRVVELLREMVAAFGYDADVASSGSEALAKAGATSPDAVLLDLNLPDESGQDVFGALRTLSDVPPVVFLTGNSDEALARELLHGGAFDYVAKPVDMAHLADVLAAAIASRAAV